MTTISEPTFIPVGRRLRQGVSGAILATTALLLTSGSSLPAQAQSPLATPDQIEVDRAVERLRATPAIKAQNAELRRRFEADPAAATADGKATLDQALDETGTVTLQYAYLLATLSKPRILWHIIAPHKWGEQTFAGSRLVFDNPDNVYRTVALSGAGRYEIRGKLDKNGPVERSFFVYELTQGDNLKKSDSQRGGDTPDAGLSDANIVTNPDGTFVVTLDKEPANGRTNHITIKKPQQILLIRNTFTDWGLQTPDTLEIKRLDTPTEASAVPEEQLFEALAKSYSQGTLRFRGLGHQFSDATLINKADTPTRRGGEWGYLSAGQYKLDKGEALVVTIDPLGSRYTGFQIADPWQISRDPITKQTGLNNTQSQKNADGTLTYVISPEDPGVANWLDTVGLYNGTFAIRWQSVKQGVTLQQAQSAVREVRVVKLSDLPSTLARVTPDERKKALAQREAGYQRRAATAP